MNTKRMPVTNEKVVSHTFGVVDQRGRVVGSDLVTYELDLVPTDEGYGYTMPAGHYFVFRPSATRNGEPYGATQDERFFSTRDERDAAVAAYLKSARKRAGASEVAAAAPAVAKPSRFKTAGQAARAQRFEAIRAKQEARYAAKVAAEFPVASPSPAP